MDFASFGIASVACITVICYLAATAIKQTPLANKWLPSICGALGGLLGVAAMYINVPDFPATDPLTALPWALFPAWLPPALTRSSNRQAKTTDQQVTGKLNNP